MSYASALARVTELEARLGITTPTNLVTVGSFDKVLAGAQNRFENRSQQLLDTSLGSTPTSALGTPGTAAAFGAPAATSGPARGLTPELNALIERIANRHKVPAELVKAIARAESGFRPDAVSPAGAQGMMQLMPATGAGLGVTNPFNAAQSIEGGARYLKNALRIFHGDVRLAVASYNAGVGAVQRYGGVPPYPETQAYVRRVLAYAREFGMVF